MFRNAAWHQGSGIPWQVGSEDRRMVGLLAFRPDSPAQTRGPDDRDTKTGRLGASEVPYLRSRDPFSHPGHLPSLLSCPNRHRTGKPESRHGRTAGRQGDGGRGTGTRRPCLYITAPLTDLAPQSAPSSGADTYQETPPVNRRSKIKKALKRPGLPDLGHLGPGKTQHLGIGGQTWADTALKGLPPRDYGWGKAKGRKKRR